MACARLQKLPQVFHSASPRVRCGAIFKPTVFMLAREDQAARAASLALRASIVGFNTSPTPGSASTLSNS
jgi:hypothetical protein